VAQPEDLRKLHLGDPSCTPTSQVTGPLFEAKIVTIEDTETRGLVLNVHHVVMDASSISLFFEDLDEYHPLPLTQNP
jgi:hypothetical protein